MLRRKKLITRLLVLAICTSLVPTTMAFAEIQTTVGTGSVTAESDFTFNANTGAITRYKGTDTTVVIPSEIGGVKVTSIGLEAFVGCKNLITITLPNSVTNIGDCAFSLCSSLTSITIPDSVTSIEHGAFNGCLSLTSITLPNSITNIGDGAFSYCSSLISITFPDSLTNIGAGMFESCSSLTKVTIPDSITSIGDYAFNRCTNAIFYVKSEKIKQLLINYPIDESKIILTVQSSTNESDFTFDASKRMITKYNGSEAEVVIPSEIGGVKVTSIGYTVFNNCSNLTSITFPDSITTISECTIKDCNNLTRIIIPNSVTYIGGEHAFGDCEKTKFYVESEKIKQLLINYGFGINESRIILNGQSPTTIKVTSIALNTTNSSLNVGETVMLTATALPSNATNKGVTWKSSNTAIATVDANGKVTAVGSGTATITCTASDGSGKSATCNVTVTNLIKVTSISLNTTGLSVLKGDVSTLTATALPSNATNKGVTWKSSNTAIATVDANGKVTAAGTGTATITCTASDGSGKSATCNVTVTNHVIVNASNFTFDASIGAITKYNGSEAEVVIPSEIGGVKVTSIGYTVFNNCSNLTSITFPDSITAIPECTIKDCNNLTSIIIPNSVTHIGGEHAFGDCEKTKFYVGSEKIKQLLINYPIPIDESRIILTGQSSTIKVTSIALNTNNLDWTVGKTGIFTVTVLPSTSTDKTVTWTSSNDSIASVSSSGVVTANSNGTVTITATAKDGSGIVGNKTVTITGQTNTTPSTSSDVKVTDIDITGSDSITTKSGTLTLTPNISPSTATVKSVIWTSNDASIATVSSSGIVTAKGNGAVTMTATASDGSGIVGTKVITVSGQTTSSSDSVLNSVSISGTEEVGHTLKTKVKYDGTKPSLKYQWQRASKKDGDYSDINGADGYEYKLKSSDNNKYIKVVITATINGQVYTVEDITSKIEKASSSYRSSDTSSEESNNSSSNNNNTAIFRPSNLTNNSPSSMSLATPNSSSPANGQFTNPSGHPVSGWINSNNKWYYLDGNGFAQVGWINGNGNWYYLSPNADANRATMKTGWVQDNGKWYYLSSSGAMVSNTTIDGYRIGYDGALIN